MSCSASGLSTQLDLLSIFLRYRISIAARSSRWVLTLKAFSNILCTFPGTNKKEDCLVRLQKA